ncbi:hypothetical protein FRC10_006145, partial [Ceratobasidium sp. 414]
FTPELDTGSADLWFGFDKGYNETFAAAIRHGDLSVNITNGTSWTSGYVGQTEGIDASDASTHNDFPLYGGIAGIGFDISCPISVAVCNETNDTWGASLMSNIFRANLSLPHHIAFFLNRNDDWSGTDTGLLNIGTYADGYSKVSKRPKIPVYSTKEDEVGKWGVLVNGITGNRKPVKLGSGINGIFSNPPNRAVSALPNTRTSAGQISNGLWHAIYQPMEGVPRPNGDLRYVVPCRAETDAVVTIECIKSYIAPAIFF